MVARYRYTFLSLGGERVIQEIDLYGVYLSMSLNGGDSQFDGTFQLDQTGKRNVDLVEATSPGRTFCVVERNDVPIGAWIVWSRVYSAQSKTIQMHGMPFDYYPRKQRILTNTIFNDVEQVEIFKSLWAQMQAVPGRNVNINVPTGVAPTVVPKSLDVRTTEFKYYSEAMSSIANTSNGFDWYVAISKEGNYFRKDLRIGYPTLGTGVHPGLSIFEYPGNVTQYYMTESMADAGTHVLLIGAGESDDMLTSEFVHSDLIVGGMPRWDVEVPRKDITTQANLNFVAGAVGPTRRPPMLTVKVTVKGDKIPEFGAYTLGDTARVVIKDPRNPTGYERDARLVGWTLNPPDSESVEEAQLLFEGDENI